LAELAKGRLRDKRQQLTQASEGWVKPHHRFPLTELLCQIDSLNESLAHFDHQVAEYGNPFDQVVLHLGTITGMGREMAPAILAEIGTDLSRFGTAHRLSAWAGVAPGNHESGGKRPSSKTRPSNRVVKSLLVQAAWAASRSQDTYLAALYQRLAARRGKQKAIVAVAHAILVIVFHLSVRNEPYKELGGDYFDKQNPETTAKRMVKRIEKLGYQVTLQPAPVAA
jgi:transposase